MRLSQFVWSLKNQICGNSFTDRLKEPLCVILLIETRLREQYSRPIIYRSISFDKALLDWRRVNGRNSERLFRAIAANHLNRVLSVTFSSLDIDSILVELGGAIRQVNSSSLDDLRNLGNLVRLEFGLLAIHDN